MRFTGNLPAQAREAPVRYLTLLARSDAEAEQHSRLLSRRPNLHSLSLLRWLEWEAGETHHRPMANGEWPAATLLQAEQRERTADAAADSLTAALRSLVVREFALTRQTLERLSRCNKPQVILGRFAGAKLQC